MDFFKISLYIHDYGNPEDPEIRVKYGYLEAGIGFIGNSFYSF